MLSTRSSKTLPALYHSVSVNSTEKLHDTLNKSMDLRDDKFAGVGSVNDISMKAGPKSGGARESDVDDANDDSKWDKGVIRERHERALARRKASRAELHHRVTGRAKETEERKLSDIATEGENEQERKDEIPAGARTTGRLEEFHGSRGGTEDGMIRGQNVTRVSYTLYKVMRLFGFASLTDSPAGAHAEWMVDLVRRLAYDVPLFMYKGVDDAKGLERTKRSVGEVIDGEYFEGDVERVLPDGTDVLFHWTELDGGERDPRGRGYMMHIAKVMRVAKNRGYGYLVFGQFPRLNGPSPVFKKGEWKFVGTEEEEPFLLNEHVRGVVPTGSGGKAYMLYLTFYSLRNIPMEAIDGMDVDGAKTERADLHSKKV